MSRDQELEIARLAGELEGTAKARFEEYEKQIAELEQQLGATEAENDILQRGHDDVYRTLRKTLEEHSTLREAAQAAVDEGRTSTRIDKILALDELLKGHQDGS